MMPAIAITTLRSGCSASTCAAARSMLAGSAVSMVTAPNPGCSAVSRSSSALRRPPRITVLPLSFKASARANPMPLVDPGMKMVLPEIFMLSSGAGGRAAQSE